MRYLGSKTSLLDDIYMLVKEYTKDGVFCDPFGGIGTVGTFMKKKGCKVITGDILFCAHCFQTALIEHFSLKIMLKKYRLVTTVFNIGNLQELLMILNIRF